MSGMDLFKIAASFIVGTFGFFMLIRGAKTANTKLILWGGALLLLSYLVFS